MPDPLSFPDTTPRLALPLLYAGQAQKEVTVNEALLRADFLLHGAIETELATPPADPDVGALWLVASSPQGAWAGQDGKLAGWSDGGWRFIAPQFGMRLLDRASGAFLLYDGEWRVIASPAEASGGAVIDVEARACLSGLIAALRSAGIFT